MGVYRFEDLRVWQAAKEQCDRVGKLIKRPDFKRDPQLCGQMNGASLSVMLNISEAFLRRRNKEMLQFLRFSAASNGEVRACYYAAHGREYIDDTERDGLLQLNTSIGKMTRRFQASLEEPVSASRTKNKGRTKDQEWTRNQGRGTDQEPRTRDGPGTKDQGPRTRDGPGTKDQEPSTTR